MIIFGSLKIQISFICLIKNHPSKLPFELLNIIKLLIFSKKYVAFCTRFNLLTPIFLLPYIIMDLPKFVIAEWATLLVDIHCPRGGS